jgi:CelD/BcsL family acetyltransferase involved in cellulose biosynthesis
VASHRSLRLIDLRELTARERGDWIELAKHALEPNPFLDPDFVLPAARAFDRGGNVRLAAVEGPDGWDCCVPVRSARSWHGAPISHTGGWLHKQCFLGTPLVAAPDALPYLLGAIRREAKGAFFGLPLVDTDAVVTSALPKGGLRYGHQSRAALHRRPGNDYLEGRLRGKHRRALRRAANQLAEELGGALTLTHHDDDAAARRFLDLEAAGWKGQRGTALLTAAGAPEFFAEMYRRLSERGAAELVFLEAGGTVCAARCNLRAGGVLFCFKVAHDESLRSFSPGMQLELLMIDRFHADASLTRMDSCTDRDSELFNRIWPDRRELVDIMVPTARPSAIVMRPALKAATAAIDRRRAVPSA